MNNSINSATDSKTNSDTANGISVKVFNGLINTAYGITGASLLTVAMVVGLNRGSVEKSIEETKASLNEVLTANEFEAPASTDFHEDSDVHEEPIYTSAVPNSLDDYPPVEKDAFASN